MRWPYEDGGPRRAQATAGSLGVERAGGLTVTSRIDPVVTMVVGDDDGCFLLRHGFGEGATALVERIDPVTLEPLSRSVDLAGGPVWPGGIGISSSGTLHVVFGNHAHLLDRDLALVATTELPRKRPYNSFVTLADGCIATKDFGGSLPGAPLSPAERQACELVVLDPESLAVRARLELPEPSIARLSADGDTIYVVGDTSLLRVRWDGTGLELDSGFTAAYRTMEGQGYGWDCVLAAGAAWFLDDGDGAERFNGSLRGLGMATTPLRLVRVDTVTGEVTSREVGHGPGGLVSNPPLIDAARRVAVGYDSGNGVICGLDLDSLEPLWERAQDHASHLLLYEESGELVTGDGSDVVVLDVSSGRELARADSGLGVQSVLFPAPGAGASFYVCALTGLSRLSACSRSSTASKPT